MSQPGGLVATDLEKVAAALRKQGAMFLIDATHAVGVLAMDVTALDPDFVIFQTYKWLLGPYGRAFLYVAKRHQKKQPGGVADLGGRRYQLSSALAGERRLYHSKHRLVVVDVGDSDTSRGSHHEGE